MNAPKPVLYLDDVTVSFDGFKALNSLSFVVEPGELRTIIGPNGAGKTTMMDVITGKTRPDKGTAFFKGVHDLTKLTEESIANLGIGRKFQRPTMFDNHTVFENLELALKADRRAFRALRDRWGAKAGASAPTPAGYAAGVAQANARRPQMDACSASKATSSWFPISSSPGVVALPAPGFRPAVTWRQRSRAVASCWRWRTA